MNIQICVIFTVGRKYQVTKMKFWKGKLKQKKNIKSENFL